MARQKHGKSIISLKFMWYALRGVYRAFVSEKNVRIHLVIAVIVTITGLYTGLSRTEWYILLIFYALVISAEMFNSAIEDLVDLISPEYNAKAEKIKDISGGAVLITAIFSIIAGCIIFIPKIFA